MRTLTFCLLATLVTGCATPPAPSLSQPMAVIYQRSESTPRSRAQVFQLMGEAKVILLGEKHDNPHHHQLQKEILEQLLEAGKRPALGFETFSQDQTGLLMNFTQGRASHFKPAAEDKQEEFLRRQLGWVHRQEWELYAPLLRLAKKYRLPVFGADLPVGTRVRLTRSGLAEMYPFEKDGLVDTGFRMEPYRQLMQQKLAVAHCQTAEESLLERLYQTWLARNDAMAHAVVAAGESLRDQPVVVVLGAGHVEHDMGVMERIAFHKPRWRQLNLGMRELPADSPATYPEPVTVAGHPFPSSHQILWFTPAVESSEEEDMCRHMPKK